jgi:hypothetical protein
MRLLAFSSRQRIGALAVACAAALAPLAALAATSSPAGPEVAVAAASVPKCSTSGLVAWLDTQGNGTAGSIYYNLEFTNLSEHVCMLLGYPGVSAVNLRGHQLGSAASRNGTKKPAAVTLARDGTANVVLQIVEAGNYPTATCRLTNAAGLRVYPPNQKASKVVPFVFQSCSRSGPIYLTVQSVQKGTGATQ